jgi:signal peptidase I
MRSTLKFLLVLAVSLLVMLAFRALVFSVYAVNGTALEPDFEAGDRVLVNRWSYGLRTGGGGLFDYGRICRQKPEVGDVVAFEDSTGAIMIGHCKALPGDTVLLEGKGRVVMPDKSRCDKQDCYYIDHAGIIAEEHIIGRVMAVLYSHRTDCPFWRGYVHERFLLSR